ncbi:OmpA family protein [Leeuwenhoekiella aequorea]|uniref:WD40 repeat protein n=1 Tax=Leeuwenhoekiella aequorea TaxID=283736 RepID=A0A4Q0P2Y7_9FLAO|nr:OmpA family protein [Leeuwenhoekiella aequorea]RXG20326.1 WD40 repeat protein [Leeuwenhoekiella aequorea]
MNYIYTLICCFVGLNVFAQSQLEKANTLHDRFIYVEAAKEYELYLETAKNVSAAVYMNVGDTYYHLRDFNNAKKYYEKWYTLAGPNSNNLQGYQYYDTLRFLKEYDKASTVVETYIKERQIDGLLNAYYEERSRFNELLKGDTLYEVKNLDINSQYADFGGSFSGNTFVFSSSRNKDINQITERDNTPYLAIYKAELNANGELTDVGLYNDKLETPYHDATVSFSPNSKYLYYASSFQDGRRKVFKGDKRNYFKIYRVDVTAKRFKKELLPFNGDEYSVGHPFVSNDGKKLYFASDMPGGYGKADIYVCDIYEDGTYSKPLNLGPLINSLVDDVFPFVSANTLYFSSEGHVGYGGLDIYKSTLTDGVYGATINLGPGINSNADDFAYVEGKSKNTGYFSSNRDGGKGGDDIYSFKYNLKECIQSITGTIYNVETKKPLANAIVTVYDPENNEFRKVETNENGVYSLDLNCAQEYRVEASKPGFSKDQLQLNTDLIPGHLMKLVDFKLKDLSDIFVTDGVTEKIKIDPIYFEYYRYNINDIAAIQMRKVLNAMIAYPEMIIKIEAHTDQRGTDYFNKTLSTNRALSTRDWLIENGIDPSRIASAIGYGESKPINICDEENENCTEVEYSENRRSEFIVVSR